MAMPISDNGRKRFPSISDAYRTAERHNL
jgi:hypothetical protein